MLTWTRPDPERAPRRSRALGDPGRLAIIDELFVSDRAPTELGQRLGMESNLLAHHLDVLSRAGMIERSRSSGDKRRRYVHLVRESLEELAPRNRIPSDRRCSSVAPTRLAPNWLLPCGVRRPESLPFAHPPG